MIAPTCACTGPDVCCNTVGLLADRILTVAVDGLRACNDGACCEGFRAFQSIPPTADPHGDSIIVAMTGMQPAYTTREGSTPMIGVWSIQFSIQIRNAGWPTIETDDLGHAITTPADNEWHQATLHALDHAELMYRAVANAAMTHRLWPGETNRHVIQKSTQVSRLTPMTPSGGIVGHEFSVIAVASL